jgi:hypothetical protein
LHTTTGPSPDSRQTSHEQLVISQNFHDGIERNFRLRPLAAAAGTTTIAILAAPPPPPPPYDARVYRGFVLGQ